MCLWWAPGRICPSWTYDLWPLYHLHQFSNPWRLMISRKLEYLPPFVAPRVTISHLEREEGKRSLGELSMEEGERNPYSMKFGSWSPCLSLSDMKTQGWVGSVS